MAAACAEIPHENIAAKQPGMEETFADGLNMEH